MVTKRNQKHKIFSKNLTKRQKYSGGDQSKTLFEFYTEIAKKNKDGSKMTPEIRDKSWAEAKAKYFAQPELKDVTPEDWAKAKAEYFAQSEVKGVTPQAESKSVMSPEIQIPSLVDEDLFNKSLASNVDVFIQKSLDMNNFFYFLEKQNQKEEKLQQSQLQQSQLQQSQLQQSQLQITHNDIPKIYPQNFRLVDAVYGGAKYYENIESSQNKSEKWFKILKKYKFLINVFSTTEVANERRNDQIKRFTLFLEMISFYRDINNELKILKSKKNKTITSLIEETKGNKEIKTLGNTVYGVKNLLQSFSQLYINEENLAKYFVNFVLFNSSIQNLFSPFTGTGEPSTELISPSDLPPPVKVNIFQLSEEKTGDIKDINRRLTSTLPASITSSALDIRNYYSQFKTDEWSLKYINDNFFKDTRKTGDNVSVLVRSTILYIISKMFNTIKRDINRAYSNDTEDESFKNSDDFLEILKTYFSYISPIFLGYIAKSFLPVSKGFFMSIIIGGWQTQIQQIKNFMIASRTNENENEVALPYNIFLNLYKRNDDSLHITNIPDNIINSDALSFVNELEEYLTYNEYLTKQTREIMIAAKIKSDTVNVYKTTNDANKVNIQNILISGHVNESATKTQYTDFKDFTEELKIGQIGSKAKMNILTVRQEPLGFNRELENSLRTFGGTRDTPITTIPDDCRLLTHIDYLGGIPNATIDCQRACLMSQLVYENTKVVRLFNFEDCWGRNEELNAEGKGLKYLAPYQPNYPFGAYTNNMSGNPIKRFNNDNYTINTGTDNLLLTNYNYVDHKCHVWIDDLLKRVYVVFRGSASTHDWRYTDLAIAQGLGFQEGRLLQIKEILRDIYRQLSHYHKKDMATYNKAKHSGRKDAKIQEDPRVAYKLIFAGHSLGGFLSIMSAAVVFNNKMFNYPNTFQKATSITFNPWFPPETTVSVSQGVLDYYVPIINYGTTCALAFGICNDFAERTIIPCCSTLSNLSAQCTGFKSFAGWGSYTNAIKGPFYYYLVSSWASTNPVNFANCHSVHNFYGANIERKLEDFSINHASLYDDLPENINITTSYLDMLFTELNKSTRPCSIIGEIAGSYPALECGFDISSNIVFGGYYRMPVAIPFDERVMRIIWNSKKDNVTVDIIPDKIGTLPPVPPVTLPPVPPVPPDVERPLMRLQIPTSTNVSSVAPGTPVTPGTLGTPGTPGTPGDDEFFDARDSGGGKKIKRTSKKLRKRRSKRTTKKIRNRLTKR